MCIAGVFLLRLWSSRRHNACGHNGITSLNTLCTCVLERGFHPTQRTQRKKRKGRNAMTSLLDRPTAGCSGQSQPPATTAYGAGTFGTLRLLRTFLRALRALRWMETQGQHNSIANDPVNWPSLPSMHHVDACAPAKLVVCVCLCC